MPRAFRPPRRPRADAVGGQQARHAARDAAGRAAAAAHDAGAAPHRRRARSSTPPRSASWARSRRSRAEITDHSGTPHGLLRVTTSLAFATHQLAPVLSEFLARHPLVQLDLLPTDRVIDLVEEGIDIADPHRPARRYELHGAQDRRGQTPDLRRAGLSRAPRHAAAARGAGAPQLHRVARTRLPQPLAVQHRRTGARDRSRRPGRRRAKASCRCSSPCRASALCA